MDSELDLASRQLTENRAEIKYLLAAGQAAGFKKEIHRHLPSHIYTKGKTITLVTTVYFDTPDFHFYRLNEAHPRQNVKVRVREYYYFDPELAEHAQDLDSLFEYTPFVFLELKRREQIVTTKQRIKILKSDLAAYLAAGGLGSRLVGSSLLDGFWQEFGQGGALAALQAVAVAHYQRDAFQDEAGNLRLSLDSELTYHLPPAGLFGRKQALIKENLPPLMGRQAGSVLEVKYRETPPVWLQELLAGLPPANFSKFRECCRCAIQEKSRAAAV